MNGFFLGLGYAMSIDNMMNNQSNDRKDNSGHGSLFFIVLGFYVIEKFRHYFVSHFKPYVVLFGVLIIGYTIVKPRLEKKFGRKVNILIYICNVAIGFAFMAIVLSYILGGYPFSEGLGLIEPNYTNMNSLLTILVSFIWLIVILLARLLDYITLCALVPIVQKLMWKYKIIKTS